MIKLNYLQYNLLEIDFKTNYSLDSLVSNLEFDSLCKEFLDSYSFKKLKTFSFSKEGFLGLFLELKGKIAISYGESEALIDAANLYRTLGFEVIFLPLNKDGSVDIAILKEKDIDYLFLSSYVMDTFLKTSLKDIKTLTNAKIISNASADFSKYSDIIYFDNYKLSAYSISAVLFFNNDEFEQLSIGFTDSLAIKFCYESLKKREITTCKETFLDNLKKEFKDDIFFFVDNSQTLNCSFHIGLKDIKARELIRTLAFEKIFLSNGEGCSLGLSKPSRVIQSMGYDEKTSRNALSFSFNNDFAKEKIEEIVKLIYKKYLQIRSLS